MQDEEAAVERIAKALYESAVQNARQEVSRLSIDLNIVTNTFIDVQHETDRSCAITIFALIDELLCDLFLLHINPSYTQSRKRLFAEFGILPTASRRMEMLFALNWINRDTFHDLNILRKMRNTFAHHVGIRSFSTQPISGYLASFQISFSNYLHTIYKDMREAGNNDRVERIIATLNCRTKYYFLMSVCFILRKAVMEMLVMPVTIKHGVHPRSILDVFPEEEGAMRHCHMTFAAIMLGIFDFIDSPQDSFTR